MIDQDLIIPDYDDVGQTTRRSEIVLFWTAVAVLWGGQAALFIALGAALCRWWY
jgi:hypothetical protein